VPLRKIRKKKKHARRSRNKTNANGNGKKNHDNKTGKSHENAISIHLTWLCSSGEQEEPIKRSAIVNVIKFAVYFQMMQYFQ